ncbi:MAG: 50S ribosomal protein L25 [Ignavibacteria bacterium]|nr:50S ribosomal protein L25 [Ignavibacteria bacterium]
MSQIVLKAKQRQAGRSASKQLRREGKVPGVYYSNSHDPIHFSVDTLDLRSIVYTAEAKVVSLQFDDDKGLPCILKDVTFDPITDKIIHLDFLGVSAGQKITVEIPIHLIGTSAGVRDGGIVEHVMHKAHVLVDPLKMPEHIDVDITNLQINSSIHIEDISVEGVEFEEKPEAVIVTCTPPKTHIEETPSAEIPEVPEVKATE